MSASRSESGTGAGEGALDAIRRRAQAGGSLPRIGLFLFDCGDAESLRKTLARIPEPLDEWLDEVVVMRDAATRIGHPASSELLGGRELTLRFHRNPRDYGYGGARKQAFEYALGRRFDVVVTMRGDGRHPPEGLPELLRPVLVGGERAVFAAPARAVGRWLSTAFQNAVLGLRLRDYHTGYRAYARSVLERIPFQINDNDRVFEAQIAIQCRALGVPIREVAVGERWRDAVAPDEPPFLLRSCWNVVDYRLHQLHVTKAGRFLVARDVRYTLKRSKTGSHMQIVGAIRPDSRVLDLGCSQGLLATPLAEKNVQVIGVDSEPPDRLAEELVEYHQHDLEKPLDLPTGRVFDYVIVSDVIEHVRNRAQLLRTARRYLKPEGRLLISTPNIALWFYRLSLLAGRFEYGPRGVLDQDHVHLYTGASFRRAVEKAGFHVLSQRVTSLPFEVVFQSTGRSRFVRSLGRMYYGLARLWPSMFAYQFILEAEITTLDEESTSDPPR